MSELRPGVPAWREVPSLGAAVAEFLAAEILRGRWPDGHRLPEVQIAEELGTSRGPVRDAFRILAEQGFVSLRPRVGAIVREASTTMIREIYEMRAILEGWVCLQAVPKVTAQDLIGVTGLLEKMESSLDRADYPVFYDVAWQLRQLLYAKCENSLVLREVEALRTRLYSLPSLAWHSESDAKAYLREYRGLIEAVRTGKAEHAARLMSALLRSTGEAVARYFEELQGAGKPIGGRKTRIE